MVHSGEMSALIDVTFSNNLAGGDGPAVLSLGAIVEMANCTFTGNSFFCEPGTYLEVMAWFNRIGCVPVNEGKGFVPLKQLLPRALVKGFGSCRCFRCSSRECRELFSGDVTISILIWW